MKKRTMEAEATAARRMRWGALLVVGVCGAVAPRQAEACEPVTLCVEWEIELEDGGWGEHVTGSSVPARGARMSLIRPSPEPPLGVFLDNEGCVTFETQYAVGHKAVLYNEAVYDGLIHVQVFESEDDQNANAVHEWAVDIPTIGDGDDVVVPVPVSTGGGSGAISSMLGTATETLYRLDQLAPGLPNQQRSLRIRYDNDARNANAGLIDLRMGRDSNSEKYVLAHELGHWLEQGVSGDGYFPNYTYGITDPECDFGINATVTEPGESDPLPPGQSNAHGIRSAEHGHAAMTEAYAHFVGAAAYSGPSYEDGVFRYYKDIDAVAFPAYQDMVDNENVVDLTHTASLGGQVAWVATMCAGGDGDGGNDWNPSSSLGHDISTELDWLRFFWGFYRSPQVSGPQPTFWEILDLISFSHVNDTWPTGPYVSSDPTAWDQLVDAVNDPTAGLTSFSSRFTALEPTYEVIND